MRQPIDTRWRRRATIHQHNAPPCLQPLEPAILQRRRSTAATPRLGQGDIDQAAALFLAAVEQSQAAIAMPHHPQRRCHAVDRAGQRSRRGRLGPLQQRTDLGQVLQRGELDGRAALHMTTVRQHLTRDLLRQEPQCACQEPCMFGQRHRRRDQPFQRGQRACIHLLGRKRRGQAARVRHQPCHQFLPEPVICRGGEEIVMAEPRCDAGANHIRPVRQWLIGRRGNPFRQQRTCPQPRRIGAKRTQIA